MRLLQGGGGRRRLLSGKGICPMVKARWVHHVPDVLAAERAGMQGSPALEISSARGTLDLLHGHPVPCRVRKLLSSQRGPGCPLESPGSFKTAASGPTCKDSLSKRCGTGPGNPDSSKCPCGPNGWPGLKTTEEGKLRKINIETQVRNAKL